jgi:hypothetical protein
MQPNMIKLFYLLDYVVRDRDSLKLSASTVEHQRWSAPNGIC